MMVDNILDEFFVDGEGPFYTEYLYKIQETTPTFGLEACTWDSTMTYLFAHKAEIISRFNEKWGYYEIGQETEERSQYMIQLKLNQLKEKYNNAFKMYETNNTNTLGRKFTSSGQNKFQDTPVTPLSVSEDYATNITDTDSETVMHDSNILDEVNANVDAYRSIITDMVEEFSPCFINVLGRV